MAVERNSSLTCRTNGLPQCRRCMLNQTQKQSLVHESIQQDGGNLQMKPQDVQNCSGPRRVIKYWLAVSFCLNALCLSALLAHMASSPEQALEAGRGSFVNGGGDMCVLHNQQCSGQGQHEYDGLGGKCRCYSCFTGSNCSEIIEDCTVNFDHGDPKMFESFWSLNHNAMATVLLGGDRMSYFSYTDAICWFLEPSLASEIRLLHKLVGNAVTDGYHIVVGTGSSQLISAALYALSSSSSHSRPVDIVSAAPFYSSYPSMTDFLKSQLHKWAGDASIYKVDPKNMYIELVTSPGNPDGMSHAAIVNGTGPIIHDLAYYWPHYTPVMVAADYDIMLFTVSKVTGHAGTRIGWALVRNADIAKKMTKFIELSTIGVSKDSQVRASQILKVIRNFYSKGLPNVSRRGLFGFAYEQMKCRWEQLRRVVSENGCFTLDIFPSGHCIFFGKERISHPAFAWLRCEKDEDCAEVFKANRILTRSGVHFGASPRYVRISMVDHDKVFQLFISRLQHMVNSCGWSAQGHV